MTLLVNNSNKSAPSSAAELILDLLSAYPSHELSVAVLGRACALFGFTEPSVRVALSRLSQQGKVSNPARGQYALDQAHNSLFREISHWLQKEERAVPWQGQWIGIVDEGVARHDRKILRRHARALEIRGFQPLSPGLHVRPDNLAGGIVVLRAELLGLGLAPQALVLGVHGLSPSDDQRARRLWDIGELRRGYREMLASLDRSEQGLDQLTLEQAGVESLTLGRAVIRRIVRDPLLPEALLPGQERQELIQRMRRYQIRSEALWEKIMRDALAPFARPDSPGNR